MNETQCPIQPLLFTPNTVRQAVKVKRGQGNINWYNYAKVVAGPQDVNVQRGVFSKKGGSNQIHYWMVHVSGYALSFTNDKRQIAVTYLSRLLVVSFGRLIAAT